MTLYFLVSAYSAADRIFLVPVGDDLPGTSNDILQAQLAAEGVDADYVVVVATEGKRQQLTRFCEMIGIKVVA